MTQTKLKLLIVEDEAEMGRLITELIEGAGYKAIHFYDANSAIEWLKCGSADLILTDLGLPGISGISFCRLLRENPATAAVPIIMLTATGDELHKVEALRTGADDYLVKPFSRKELLARIEALFRRCRGGGAAGADRVLRSGPLTLDLDAGVVAINGKELSLNPKEYALLALFLRKPGHILTYSYFAESVWGEGVIATRDTIKVTVHRLREKLGRCGACVEAMPGQGYKWHNPD